MADDPDEMVRALKATGLPQPETYEPVVQGIAHSMETPGAVMSQNPYQPGTEEHQWYENNRADNMGQWANRTALGMMGGGVPMAEEGAAGIFGGKLARTADIKALIEANKMREGGKVMPDIYNDTGWFRPPTDNKWRFEIPDNQARMMGHGIDYTEEGQGVTGAAPLMLQHDELYKAYPQLKDAYISNNVYQKPMNGIGTGEWDAKGPKATVNAPNLSNARSVGLHEMQHAVQDIENFARGGNSGMFSWMQEKAPTKLPLHELKSDPYDMYQRLAGEVEARNTQTRQPFTAEQRKYRLPWRTQDEGYNNQLVLTDPKTMLIKTLKRNQ